MTTIVITGQVHTGKTTVCQKVAHLAQQRGFCVRGILTPPLLDSVGARLGIEALDLEGGDRRELARVDRDFGGPHVGPYRFDPSSLQWGHDVIARAIAVGCDLLILDEIGRLELEQNTGFSHVLRLLETSVVPRSLLVVRDTLMDAFRRRLPALKFVVLELNLENRNSLPMEIAQRLRLVQSPNKH